MTDRNVDVWTNVWKGLHVLAVTGLFYVSGSGGTPWFLLFLLMFLSANLSISIVRPRAVKLAFIALSIGLIVWSGSSLFLPAFLLLPVNLHELSASFVSRPRPVWSLAAMLAPLLILPQALMLPYGLIAAASFTYLTLLVVCADKIRTYKNEMDRLRLEQRQLTSRLDDSEAFLRQSAYTSTLEERNRLSQEIHDKVGHAMTGALIQMEAAKRLLGTDPDKSAELLQNAIHISKDGIDSIRHVLNNMKPPTEQLGLNRLRLFVEAFSARHPVRTVLTHSGDMDVIQPIHWKIIQENTEEALTNTLKHAGSTAVTIHIQVLNTMIKAAVSDNGRGGSRIVKGLGLAGMEERAAALNGTVVADGSNGFTVTTLIPLNPRHSDSGG